MKNVKKEIALEFRAWRLVPGNPGVTAALPPNRPSLAGGPSALPFNLRNSPDSFKSALLPGPRSPLDTPAKALIARARSAANSSPAFICSGPSFSYSTLTFNYSTENATRLEQT